MYINHEKYALVNGVVLDGTRDMTLRTGLAVCVDGDRIAAVCDAATPRGTLRGSGPISAATSAGSSR